MSNATTDLATTQATQIQRHQTAVGDRGIVVSSFDDLWRMAVAVSKSGLAPRGINTPEAVMIAIEMGMELGLPPLAALRGIAVINGKPSIYGDLAMAVVHRSGRLEWIKESWTGDDDTRTAICEVKRVGQPLPMSRHFSMKDAKRAGLLGKDGPWKTYPDRMLQMRARGYALRDAFADVLQGLYLAEEAQDIPIETPAPDVQSAVIEGEAVTPDPLAGFGSDDSPASDGQQPADVVAPVHNPDAPAATMAQVQPAAPAADPSDAEDPGDPEIQTIDDLKRCVDLICGERGLDLSVGAAAVASWLKLSTRKGKPPTPNMYNEAWEAAQEGRGVFAGLAEPAVAT